MEGDITVTIYNCDICNRYDAYSHEEDAIAAGWKHPNRCYGCYEFFKRCADCEDVLYYCLCPGNFYEKAHTNKRHSI